MVDPSRRDLLRHMLGAASVAAVGSSAWITRASSQTPFARDPFSLGVASGYPTSSGVVLWTRLAPEPLAADGGMPPSPVSVTWEIAYDEQFKRIARRGVASAEAEWAHSVHVEVQGLEPAREYWYRFIAGDARSAVGRTRTAPAAGASLDRMRIAVASCQQYEHGYYVAYRRMIEDDPALVVHVGDYIYEVSWGDDFVRSHGSGECRTLAEYRVRHALYRSDADLQAAHAVCPWVLMWDDHEVNNDYADAVSEKNENPTTFRARRAAAYRAYYEHMPLPRRAAPNGSAMRMYATSAYGNLVNVHLLDNRQYRSAQACPRRGEVVTKKVHPEECPELSDAGRTMLGMEQEAWLGKQLAESRARWNLLAQGVVMAYVTEEPRPARLFTTDGWSGYPAARTRLMQQLHTNKVSNPIVFGGDVHSFVAADLHLDPADPATTCVGSELVVSSITSQPPPQSLLQKYRDYNPNVLFSTTASRGYLRVDLSPTVMKTDLVAMETVKRRESTSRVLASFAVESGKAGLKKA